MAFIRIEELLIDEYNEAEMAAHLVSPAEVLQVFRRGFELLKNANRHSAEYLMVGRTTGGRWLTIPIARTPAYGLWRPATAYPSKESERAKLKGRMK